MRTRRSDASWRGVGRWLLFVLLVVVGAWFLGLQLAPQRHDAVAPTSRSGSASSDAPSLSSVHPAYSPLVLENAASDSSTPSEAQPDRRGLSGTVYGPGRVPVRAAHVWLVAQQAESERITAAVATDDDGRFLANPGADAVVGIRVRASGFLPLDIRVSDEAVLQHQELHLDRGASIVGSVIDEAGNAVEGITVVASHPANRSAWPHTSTMACEGDLGSGSTGTSDSDGQFELSGLSPSAAYQVRAVPSGCITCWGDPPSYLPGTSHATVVVRRLARLNVSVIDEQGGRDLVRVASFRLGFEGACSPCPVPPGMPAVTTLSNGVQARCFYIAAPEPVPGEETKVPRGVDVSIEAASPGYERVSVRHHVVFGEVSNLTATLKPTTGVSPLPVEVQVHTPRGTYEGVLGLRISRAEISLPVSNGKGAWPIYLPPAPFEIRVHGEGASGRWIRGAAHPVRGHLPEDVMHPVVHIELQAAPVAVAAHGPGGARLLDFDLYVKTAGGSQGRGMSTGWAALARREQSKRANESPVVWLPIGRHDLIAYAEGIGMGQVSIEVSDQDAPERVNIVLSTR